MLLADVCLTSYVCLSVCLSRTSGLSREQEDQNWHRGSPRHMWLDHHFQGQRSRSPGRFTHRRVGASGSCSGGRGNVLAVRNCCYVAVYSAPRSASAPTGGRGISWRPPAYSLFTITKTLLIIITKNLHKLSEHMGSWRSWLLILGVLLSVVL